MVIYFKLLMFWRVKKYENENSYTNGWRRLPRFERSDKMGYKKRS
jgi:hypothetical protein